MRKDVIKYFLRPGFYLLAFLLVGTPASYSQTPKGVSAPLPARPKITPAVKVTPTPPPIKKKHPPTQKPLPQTKPPKPPVKSPPPTIKKTVPAIKKPAPPVKKPVTPTKKPLPVPQKPGPTEEQAFWPFIPRDDQILFGPKGARKLYRSNDIIFLWQDAVREFSDKRENLKALTEEQEQIYAQLAQMNSKTVDNLAVSTKDDKQSLLKEALENENRIREVQESQKKLSQQIVNQAAGIRARLLDLRSRLDRSAANMEKTSNGDPKKTISTKKILDYKRLIRDAASLMEQIQRDPKFGRDYLNFEMKNFTAVNIAGKEESDSALVDRFKEQISSLRRSQRLIRYRLDSDEKELELLNRIMQKMAQRHENLQREAEEKTLEAEKEAAEEKKARKEAEEKIKDEPAAKLQAPPKQKVPSP